jgi:hypothetical protein
MRWKGFCVKTKSVCSSRTAVYVLHLYKFTPKELNVSPLIAALLRDDDETPVPEEEKATFYAQAESEVRLRFLLWEIEAFMNG